MEKYFCVSMMASKKNGTLYVGVTSNLPSGVTQHKNGVIEGFTSKYVVDRLVYFETHGSAESAIRRERQIKKWPRAWKLRLIERANPAWRDLYAEIV
jgi:putative endonuclease